MTPRQVERLARSMEQRLEWIAERCAELRSKAEEGDQLAAAFWAGLQDNEISPSTGIISIAEDAIRKWEHHDA